MTGRGHAGDTFATLHVDGRLCSARPMRGSAVGHARGLAIVAESTPEVTEACRWMPGRVLVLSGEAISPASAAVVARSACLATFAAIVVVASDEADLAHMGEDAVPIPVVLVTRAEDGPWTRRATRVSVGVPRRAEPVHDIRATHHERRRIPGSGRMASPAADRR